MKWHCWPTICCCSNASLWCTNGHYKWWNDTDGLPYVAAGMFHYDTNEHYKWWNGTDGLMLLQVCSLMCTNGHVKLRPCCQSTTSAGARSSWLGTPLRCTTAPIPTVSPCESLLGNGQYNCDDGSLGIDVEEVVPHFLKRFIFCYVN